jgi:hypothetical protein
MLYSILDLFGNWIDFNFKSSFDIAVYIQCKPMDVQSLQSSYFLVFYHFGFETTTLTFSRIIDFDDATNLFDLKLKSIQLPKRSKIEYNIALISNREDFKTIY